ncbi:hypothetical protein Lo5R7ANS_29 [Mesorhizobium phage vB_MloP_Lo5R7ANS]|uniref:Uncharacterized protein n=1 Tax=Mesorhizobium phage vB_MloP_Lo5R7ANS TaxID=1527771 RepID=A0A076YNU8_9CAUD|nr:hypothetical protein Lo5R7ANS_29 [Mesorhizobium phage vB_MloP_Lo5R7ANS]AIK68499.1 hypothetical protein Lo5R7ANS_29 [Mesorhizobium phage vB_MloP_Lo5R7ANS]
MTPKDMAADLAGDFLEFAQDLLKVSREDNVKAIAGRPVTHVYDAAEMARIIFTTAYQVHHRLMSVANTMRIEEVG